MRRSLEQNIRRKNIIMIASGILACFGTIFLCLLLFGAVASLVELSDGIMAAMSGIALAAGCFSAAYTIAKKRRRNGMLTGLACGGAVFFIVMLAGIIFVRSFSAGGFISKLLIILSCSCIGGIIGVNSPRRFR